MPDRGSACLIPALHWCPHPSCSDALNGIPIDCRFEGARAAYSIIARGPEQIMSQFSISYGMVLNLLSTRNLQDCEHFLARSFLRFQTAGNVEETIAEAQRLDNEAESMLRKLHGGDGDLFKKYEAANVRN